MRTYKLFTILFITGMLAASCELQEPMRPASGYSQFYVETEQPSSSEPGTKTFADENGMVLWVNGDLVSVFNKMSYATKYRYDGGTGTTGGMLTEIPDSGSATGTNVSHYYAVYPYETYNGLDNSENVISKIRNEQTWDYCSFGSGDNLMVAVSDDNKFQFKNVGGYIVLRLYGEGRVSSIRLQGNNNEILAGDVKVTATIGSDPTVAMQKGSRYTTYKSVTLQCDDPVELTGSSKDNPVEFWFVIPATTFTQGLSFVVTDPDGNTFEKSTSNEIVVQRSHSKPLKTQVDFTASLKVNFADAIFKAYCVENFDTDRDGEISYSEALIVTDIVCRDKNIQSLSGIEHFTNLTSLSCNNNQLTSLDVSQNTALRALRCSSNQLTRLDVSQNTALTSLSCSSNQLTSLDVSQNTALTYLSCYSNQLTSLDVSQNTALFNLDCDHNQLTTLDVSQNTALRALLCSSNQLTRLNVSQNTALQSLSCSSNQLTSLDVSHNTALTYLSCYSNQLTSLDVSQNTALTRLSCPSNQLTSLDVSHNTALTDLSCYSNQLTSLDVSQNTALTSLYCDSNQLTSLDVSQNTALTRLSCSSNQLTSLDVSNNSSISELFANNNSDIIFFIRSGQVFKRFIYDGTATIREKGEPMPQGNVLFEDALFKVYCVNNFDIDGDGEVSYSEAAIVTSIFVSGKSITSFVGIEHFINLTILTLSGSNITSLNIGQLQALKQFFCCDNTYMTEVDISGAISLEKISCCDNALTSLDVSQNTALTRLYCDSNQLTSLDVSQNTALQSLSCSSNQLTSLDVSHNTALTDLSCSSNQLTSLDVSHNTALTSLYCESNQLTSLDVSQNTALQSLSCSSNQLTSLDVSQNTALTSLSCSSNQLMSLDVSNNTVLTSLSCSDNQLLTEIWLKTGQTISSFSYDTNVTAIKYKE